MALSLSSLSWPTFPLSNENPTGLLPHPLLLTILLHCFTSISPFKHQNQVSCLLLGRTKPIYSFPHPPSRFSSRFPASKRRRAAANGGEWWRGLILVFSWASFLFQLRFIILLSLFMHCLANHQRGGVFRRRRQRPTTVGLPFSSLNDVSLFYSVLRLIFG